jgi:drug/metabolite transporter (DMT)-like permease
VKNRFVLAAWLVMIFLGGGNAVAVRLSNSQLPPFWGATLRFGSAAILFWMMAWARKLSLPARRTVVGILLYGSANIGINYALLYWALLVVPATTTMVLLALGPLFTFFFAVLHRQEKFRWLGLLGAVIAFGGIFLGVGDQLGGDLPFAALAALIVAALIQSEANVLYKTLPPTNPIIVNAVGLSIGTLILLIFSVVNGESWILPASRGGWITYAYLVVLGSGGLFLLFLYVLERWTASATSYAFLLFPVATIVIASIVLQEVVTSRFMLGTVVVLLGVWVGALWQPRKGNPAS